MRVLLVNNHCITDPTAGVVHCLLTICRWLAEEGHDCRVLTTARFEAPVTFTIDEHLASLGAPIRKKSRSRPSAKAGQPRAAVPRPLTLYEVGGVAITMLMTQHNDERYPDREEARQYVALCEKMLDDYRPELVIACNGHPMIIESLRVAQEHGAATVFGLRGYGYYDRRYFDHVNHVLTCSQLITDVHHEKIGLLSHPIDSPIEWSRVLCGEESRAFLTFVNPSVHKGVLLFARLAEMLGNERPDIPILVIQSGHTAAALNSIPEIDFTRYPQIMAAPPVPHPKDYLALSKVVMVPSVWEEPFGRVAAEAMINGIPPLVGDRGALADVVGGDYSTGGGGRVLPIPEWMDPMEVRLPTADEVRPWFDAVCQLWDDAELYQAMSNRAREIAAKRYAEEHVRRQHLDYLLACKPGVRPFSD